MKQRRGSIFAHYEPKLQAFLDFVLAQYIKQGVEELDQEKLTFPHLGRRERLTLVEGKVIKGIV